MNEALTARSLNILRTLVGFDTVSRHSNLALIDWVENLLTENGAVCTRVPSPCGKKANLLARIGQDAPGGIVLSGHTDVVPVDGQIWDSEPFTLTQKGNMLFGRGTADMKSFIAVCLSLVPFFKEHVQKRPIYLALSYDEEVGCLGVPHLLAHTAQHLAHRPAFAVIGEPTMMQVVTAHKGVLSFETVVHGLEAHSSQPQLGINAVHIACELVVFLKDIAAELASTGLRDERFMPPYSTVHVGVINGGTARNIIARECSFTWEIRPLPTDNADTIASRFFAHCQAQEAELKKNYAGAAITSKPISRMTGVTLPPEGEAAASAVMRCAHSNQQHAVSFGTEAGVFQEHGIPAIICGPGNIEQAHKPNEFVEISQLNACADFLMRLAQEPCQ